MQRIIDIKWKYNSGDRSQVSGVRYAPTLKLRNTETNEINNIELVNYKFNFKLSEVKHCIGYWTSPQPSPNRRGSSLGGYNPCPINSKIESATYTQCAYCEKIQGFEIYLVNFYGNISHE